MYCPPACELGLMRFFLFEVLFDLECLYSHVLHVSDFQFRISCRTKMNTMQMSVLIPYIVVFRCMFTSWAKKKKKIKKWVIYSGHKTERITNQMQKG